MSNYPLFQAFDNQEYKNIKKYSKASEIPLLRHDFDVNDYAGLIKKDFITKWNKEINGLRSKKDVMADLTSLFDHDATLAVQKILLFRIISSLDNLDEQKCTITTSRIASLVHHVVDGFLRDNSKVSIMQDLSILELSLMIAIKHHNDIYDGDPFNFEIILTRLHKFQNATGDLTTSGPTDRAVVLKAFDVLKVNTIFIQFNSCDRFTQFHDIKPMFFLFLFQHLGLIVPFGNSLKELKEFQMHRLQLQNFQIDKAVSQYRFLPTRISQWATSSQA